MLPVDGLKMLDNGLEVYDQLLPNGLADRWVELAKKKSSRKPLGRAYRIVKGSTSKSVPTALKVALERCLA